MNEHCRGIVRRLFSELRYFLSERIIMSNAKMPNSTMSMEAKEQYGLEIRKLRRRKVFAQVMIVIGFVFFALLSFLFVNWYTDCEKGGCRGDGGLGDALAVMFSGILAIFILQSLSIPMLI